MSPRFSINNAVDIFVTHIQDKGNVALRYTVGAPAFHVPNHEIGIFVIAVFFAAVVVLSPFGNHVQHIVSWCADKEMAGIYAARIVASVTNKHFGGDWLATYLITKPVRSFIIAIYTESAISIAETRGLPFPTFIRADHVGEFNFRPETRNYGMIIHGA